MKKGLSSRPSAVAKVTATTNKWGQVSAGVKGVSQSTIVKGFKETKK
jgi:hypothetical protein